MKTIEDIKYTPIRDIIFFPFYFLIMGMFVGLLLIVSFFDYVATKLKKTKEKPR